MIIILLYSGAVTAGSSPPVPHTVDFNDKVNFVKIEFFFEFWAQQMLFYYIILSQIIDVVLY